MQIALVIEDNSDNMELITFLLEANGYATHRSWNGMDGVIRAKELQPDFILLDVMLPDIDGFEVMKRLKSDQSTENIPVVAVTSLAMTGDRERLLGAGCVGYIEKPLDIALVVDQIRDFLRAAN